MTEDQLNQQFAKFFGQVTAHVDKRFAELHSEIHNLHGQVDGVRNTVDGIAKRLDDDATEQTITNDHHESWIKQLADNTDTKLVPES